MPPGYIRAGLFEFNPNRHDYSVKHFLGHTIEGSGFPEVEQALDILARHPATANHICRQIATYFVSDNPPAPLVRAWRRPSSAPTATSRACSD